MLSKTITDSRIINIKDIAHCEKAFVVDATQSYFIDGCSFMIRNLQTEPGVTNKPSKMKPELIYINTLYLEFLVLGVLGC